MNVDSVTDSEIFSWIEKSLNNNKFKNYKINISDKSEQSGGYLGEIVFAGITGITNNEDKKKPLNWAIKYRKLNDDLTGTLPTKAAFDNEIYFYDQTFLTFKKFQFNKSILDGFDSVPKCYNTLILDNMEVLVLDNLKERGYELHDRKIPLNTCHLKAILKEYGKLHALSFALRQQKTEHFNKLAEHFKNDIFKKFLEAEGGKESVGIAIEKVLKLLRDRNELYLAEKLENIVTKHPTDIIIDLMEENESQSVIIHGDCWNNNFMFKYQDAGRTTPTSVAILDWQFSGLRSPVFDLSFLFYATCSNDELDKFDELLKFYHTSFSTFLKELGNNPEEIFSYSSLEAHWKKYSLALLLFVLMLLPIWLGDKDDAPSLDNSKEGGTFNDIVRSDIKDVEPYFERVKAILSHYFKSTSK